ncbi:MAG: hypothetical protein H6843_06225 [Rhodospirillaceae bacterium]|nr:hypothetical protein [Rhodospirillaceae bacterium]
MEQAGMLEALRAKLGALGRPGGGAGRVVPLGLGPVDAGLPGGGLAACGVHEIADAALADAALADAALAGVPHADIGHAGAMAALPDDGLRLGEDGAATGFAAWAAGRLLAASGAGGAVWIAAEDDLYPPGLVRFGLAPADLLHVRTPRLRDRLWALEECLRSGAVAVAVAELEAIDLTAGRRLQLAAEAGGAAAILLHRAAGRRRATVLSASPALTRWRVAAVPADPAVTAVGKRVGREAGREVGREADGAVWRLDLVRCRDGRPGRWWVDWGALRPAGVAWATVVAPLHRAERGGRMAAPADTQCAAGYAAGERGEQAA